MKASVVTAYGGPEVMKYQDMPDPKPDAGNVLVRVAGIGINPEDMLSATATRRIGIARRAVVSRATTPMWRRTLAGRVALLIRQKNQTFAATTLTKTGVNAIGAQPTYRSAASSTGRSAKAFNRARHLA